GKNPIDPEAVQVDQYDKETDPTRFKDCGAACILMVVRAMGLEPKLRQLVNKKDPAKVTLQQQIDHIRNINGNAPGKADMTVQQVRNCLVDVLHELGVPKDKIDLQKAFALVGAEKYFSTGMNKNGKPGEKGRAESFLQAACVDGSAAIVMGLPNPAAWGWGGTEDVDAPNRRLDPNKT